MLRQKYCRKHLFHLRIRLILLARFTIVSVSAYVSDLSACVYVCLCLSVRKVYCGQTADWIRMPFGMMSGVGRGMGVLDGGSDRLRERGSFGGEFGASHCNQWEFVA